MGREERSDKALLILGLPSSSLRSSSRLVSFHSLSPVEYVDVVVVASGRDPAAVGAPLDGVYVLRKGVVLHLLHENGGVEHAYVAVAVADGNVLAVWAPAAVPCGVGQLGSLEDLLLDAAPDIQDAVLADSGELALLGRVDAEAANLQMFMVLERR